jgi:CRISPR-associated protein Csb1
MTTFDLPTSPRLLFHAELVPVQGKRFQPTGFPDVGAGVYTLPDGKEQLLVESAQSVANRLEAACWDDVEKELAAPLKGLSYVRVNSADGEMLTTSIQEAHRLNSAYIQNSPLQAILDAELGADANAARKNLVGMLAKYDVGCLLHGGFFPKMKAAGSPRLSRALSGFIEAEGVGRVTTGGVKNDRVQPGSDADAGKTAEEGFGNVPFHRTEFVADHIYAYFNLDLEQLRGYRLGVEMERVLFALSLFKVQKFLATGLRLRTACDLAVDAIIVKTPSAFKIPTLDEVTAALPALIQAAQKHFASPPVTTTTFTTGEKKPKAVKPAKDAKATAS